MALTTIEKKLDQRPRNVSDEGCRKGIQGPCQMGVLPDESHAYSAKYHCPECRQGADVLVRKGQQEQSQCDSGSEPGNCQHACDNVPLQDGDGYECNGHLDKPPKDSQLFCEWK